MSFDVGQFRALESTESAVPHRTAGSFRGEDLTSGLGVAMTVAGAERLDDIRAVLEDLHGVQHPHLLPVQQVVQYADRVAVICRWPSGGRLTDLLGRRPVLTAAETLTVLIPLAAALASIHQGGQRHGDVGPGTIWFEPAGRPMLGSGGAAQVGLLLRDGLPSQISDVAPEVVRGKRNAGDAVTPAADVFSLGSVALRCLIGRPAWPADDPAEVLVQSAAGMWPDLPDEAGPPALVMLIRAMLRADAARRPGAADVVARLAAVGVPQPVTLGPVRAVDATSRWRGWRDPSGPDSEAGESVPAPLVGGPAEPSAAAASASLHPPEGPGDDDERAVEPSGAGTARTVGPVPRRPSRAARAGIAALSALLAVVVAVQLGLWWTGRDLPGDAAGQVSAASAGSAEPASTDWLQVVTELDADRARAFATANPAALAQVYLPESAPALADAATIGQLATQGWTVPGGVHDITSVTVDPDTPPVTDGTASPANPVRLIVVDSLPELAIVDGAGQQVGRTAAREQQQRTLTVVRTAAGYRISAVELR